MMKHSRAVKTSKKAVHSSSKTLIKKMTTITPTTTPPPNTKPDKKNMTMDKEWQKYKKEYAKTYTSELDELKHYALYKESQKEVLEHNKLFEAGKVKYTKAINEKSDQKLEEFLALNFGFGFDDK
ncbi:unnamed protein product [Medioppia subpectinata]|uniref:Cathepsin propeptide inhibitor domain-containing protein n=1 Tax=Medioppia subpectinata TaxID=1979941 RepID=A0A7R9PZ56_9ACAR|nr:unnamed protein product [Medioppia subpectinata]CAG2105867.1 unnamed protein product [Medioppia subpectinata]